MYALSPNGLKLVLLKQVVLQDKTVRNYLLVKPVSGGSPKIIDDTMRFSRAYGALIWAVDGKSIWFTRTDDLAVQRDDLVRVSLDGKPIQALVTTDMLFRIAPHPDARRIMAGERTGARSIRDRESVAR